MRHLYYPSCKTINRWRWFSRRGRESVASAFAYKGDQYLSYDSLQPMPTLISQDARPKIVDAPLTRISRMGRGAFVYRVWSQGGLYIQKHQRHTTVIILWLIEGYLTATINRKTEMENLRLDQTGLPKLSETGRLTGTAPCSDRQETAGRVSGRV